MSPTDRVIQKTQFRCLIVAAVLHLFVAAVMGANIITALNFTTMHTFAQNAASGRNTTAVSNMTGSSSSCSNGSTASSCYDLGYQNALANPGKTCPSGYSYNYCALLQYNK